MILRALFLRPTRERPARFAATAGGVALGVAAVVATFAGSGTAIATIHEDVTALGGEPWLEIVRAGGVDEEVMRALAPFCARWIVMPIVEEIAHLPRARDVVRVVGFDPLAETRLAERLAGAEESRVRLREDVLEALLHERAAVFPRRLAEELGLAAGERCELLVRGARIELAVAGTFERARGDLASIDRSLFVDIALAQELFGRAGTVDRIVLRPRYAAEGEGSADAHRSGAREDAAAGAAERERIAAALPAGYFVRAPEERARDSERMVAALRFNLRALSGISVLVGIVLVATALATSVVERRERIALLRSLGASRAQLARAVIAECATIGALGGAAGVVLGWLGSRVALAGARGSLASIAPASPEGTIVFEPRWIPLGLALGIGASVVAGLLPLREALATPPIQGLRTEHRPRLARREQIVRAALVVLLVGAAVVLARMPPRDERPVGALTAALALLTVMLVVAAPAVDLLAGARRALAHASPSLRLAQAALAVGRRRAAWAAAAVGVALALAIAMTAMIGSFRTTIVRWNDGALRSDLFVRPLASGAGIGVGRLDPEVERAARRLFGDGAVEAFVPVGASYRGGPITLAGIELAIAARESTMPILDGRPAREVFGEALARERCVVNESFARRFGIGRGDRIRVETAGRTIEREVAGAYVDFSNPLGLVLVDRALLDELHPGAAPESLTIYLPEGLEPLEARAELLDALGPSFAIDVLLREELHAAVLGVFDRTFAVTSALRLVASTVAVIAVLTVLFALVHERRRELALARVLGASRAQLVLTVALQGGLLGAAGVLGGVVLGLAVGWLLVRVVNVQSFGWSLSFLPPWGGIAATALLAVLAALGAGLVASARALRLAPAEVLDDER